MFEEYEKLCRQPTIDASRRRLELDANDKCARSLTTTDGGTTQLSAAVNEESFDQKLNRNEDHAKLSKNRTAVFQPCDVGKGHRGQRQQTRKLSREPPPTLSIAPYFDKGYYKKRDEGKLNLVSWKLQELRSAVSRTPDIQQIVYQKRGVIESFVITGWLDRERLCKGPTS